MTPADCPAWHDRVCELAKDYGRGQTEYDQVNNCKDSLRIIFDKVDAKNYATYVTLWNALADSEPLLRTADQKLRGIARHSINVFWFGYWLINHPLLKDVFCNLWEEMRKSRTDIPCLEKVKATDALNAIWLLTSLFHDSCRFYEHSKSITEKCDGFFKDFKSLEMGHSIWQMGNASVLLNAIDPVLSSIHIGSSDSMVKEIKQHIELCSQKEMPDHGAVAAAYLMKIGKSTGQADVFSEYAAEAARAILLHTCLPRVFEQLHIDDCDKFTPIEWGKDPLACLLLFCDQIQTWDRHDPTNEDKNYPDRAELSYLEINKDVDNPKLEGCIDYIAPSRVNMYPDLRQDIKGSLNQVILERPKKILLHVIKDGHWPFSVHLNCALSGDKLNIDMDFT